MKKKPTEKVVNAIPDILKNALRWAKENFDQHAQDVLGSATGTVGVIIKLFGQSLIDKYFAKQTAKRLENFGLQTYLKAAFIQANKSVEIIADDLKRDVSHREILDIFDLIVTEQIEAFDPTDILLIFQPKYHPASVLIKNNYLRILECLEASQTALNTFKKLFNEQIEGQIKEEFGDDYEKHLEEIEAFRLRDNETDILWDTLQLRRIGFQESEDLGYETTFAQWEKVSDFREKEKEPFDEEENDKQESDLKTITELIEEYFSVNSTNHLEKILFIIADFGKGKSVFLRQYAAQLAKTYLETGEGDFPIYFNLRNFKNYSSELKLGMIADYLQTNYGIKIDSEYFQKKHYVFLIDSLDESGELTKKSIDKVITSIKCIQKIDKEKYRTNRIIITSRPFEDRLEYHLRNHKPHIIPNEEGRDIEYFICLHGFKKSQFNHWLSETLKDYVDFVKISANGFAHHIIESIKQHQEIDLYEELLKNRTLSRSELRRPIFAYMIYQLILKNIDFLALGRIGVYLSFLNLLTKEAKHIHDPAYKINLKEEFAFRNILHTIAALWMHERQQGKQGILNKADVCRVFDGEDKGETDDQILARYEKQEIVEIQFLSHSYFGEKGNTLHFQHQSFAEILLAEYYLKVFIKYALDEEGGVEEARTKLILGMPSEQTIQFLEEMLWLLRDSAVAESTSKVIEKRKLLFPLMASLATPKYKKLFCNDIYYGWYKHCDLEENQVEYPFESLENWCMDQQKLDKIIKLASEIIESKANYHLAKAEAKSCLYNKEVLTIQNYGFKTTPEVDRWLALLVGNALFNNQKNKKFFASQIGNSFHLLFMISIFYHAFGVGVPSWGKKFFRGLDMSSCEDIFELRCLHLEGVDFSHSYLRNLDAFGVNLRKCQFINTIFDDVDFRFADLTGSRFLNISTVKGNLELFYSRSTWTVITPLAFCYKFCPDKYPKDDVTVKSFISSPDEIYKILSSLQGLFVYGLENELFTIDEIKTWFHFESKNVEEESFQLIDELNDKLGDSYKKSGQYEEAINAYLIVVQKDPTNTNVYDKLGDAYQKLGRYDEAVEVFEKAVKINQGNCDLYFYLGIFYYLVTRYDDAIQILKECKESDLDNDSYYALLGLIFATLSQKEEAIAVLKKALGTESQSSLLNSILGIIYYINEQYEESKEYIDKAFSIDNPKNIDKSLRIICFFLDKKIDKALDLFSQSIEKAALDKTDIQIFLNILNLIVSTPNPPQGIHEFIEQVNQLLN